MYSLKFKETLEQDETQYWRALWEEWQPQSQILVTRGDWSGRYKTGGEPTLLEGLRKCASKELGVIPTSPFKKSSSSSSTTSCIKTEITNKIASSSLKCFQEFLSSEMCYFWRKKKSEGKKKIFILKAPSGAYLFITNHSHNCSWHIVNISLKSDFFFF